MERSNILFQRTLEVRFSAVGTMLAHQVIRKAGTYVYYSLDFISFLSFGFDNSLCLAGNSGRLTSAIPVSAVFPCVQTLLQLPVFGIFNVRTDVDAYNCTPGLYGHRKNLHWKLILGEKSLAAAGTRTRVSVTPGFSVGRCAS